MCDLKGFQYSDLAEILWQWVIFNFPKFWFQPRGCMTSLKIRGRWGRSRPRSFLTSQDQGKSFEYHIWGSKWPRPCLASSSLKRPRIFKEVIQPRGWNQNFVKLDFIHSHKISAKSEYWNPFKSHIFGSKLVHLVEAVLASKFHIPNFFQWILKIFILIYLQITGKVVFLRGDLVFFKPGLESDSNFELL